MTAMWSIKNVFKHPRLYELIGRFRAEKVFSKWTPHDREMLAFYSPFVSRGTVCFDVGANIGNRVRIFLGLQAHVVAVEPQERCIKILRGAYGENRRLTIVQKALGESEGEAEMMMGNESTISSLSPEWVDAVQKSGRFTACNWDRKRTVSLTTLDRLIEQHGIPSFIKVDVEGFEYEVVKGLSRPVGTLSLEFTPEFIDSTFRCIDHLQRLGDIRLNYSVGETMQLASPEWMTPQEMIQILLGFRGDNRLFGDVYVQFLP
jgi:FkbM family methyltransferase